MMLSDMDGILKSASKVSLIFVLRQRVSEENSKYSKSLAYMRKAEEALLTEEDYIGPLAILFQLSGPQSTASDEFIKSLFEQVRTVFKQTHQDIREKDVAEVIIMMSSSSDTSAAPWNGDLFGAIASQLYPNLDWNLVFQHLDRSLFQPRQMTSFRIVVGVFTGAGQRFGTFLKGLWDWTSAVSLLAVIQLISYAPPTVTGLLESPYSLVLSMDDFASGTNTQVQGDSAELSKQTWNSLNMVESILKLTFDSNVDVQRSAIGFLESEFARNPELIFLGAAQYAGTWSTRHDELVAKGFDYFFSGNGSHQLVFIRLTQINYEYLVAAVVEFYNSNSLSITRILDIAQITNNLDRFLGIQPYRFAVDLACIACMNNLISLDKWMGSFITEKDDEFTRALLDFLHSKAKAQVDKLQMPHLNPVTISLSMQVVVTILRALMKE